MRRLALACLAAAAALAALAGAPARAGGPAMLIGAVEDEVLAPTAVETKANLDLLRLAGLDSVRVSAYWGPTQVEVSDIDRPKLDALAQATALTGTRVILNVKHKGSGTTPLSETDRADFATYAAALARAYPRFRDVIVGNEPNLNRFWMPQFGEAGEDVAATAYLQLLGQVYDALKAVSPRITVIGGALAPRGVDRPNTGRDTHAPVTFIRDMGAAYRASGRTRPVMDVLAVHPYGDTSAQAPSQSAHPNTPHLGMADYDKLVRVLGETFDGTPQRGSTLPILYAEYGTETQVASELEGAYDGTEPATTKPVDEETQAAYYEEAITMAFCQPNVRGILLLHALDERARLGWQSGLFRVDRTPKPSLATVAASTARSRRGVLAACPGLALVPAVRFVGWPRGSALKARAPLPVRLRCSIDCVVRARLEKPGARRPLALVSATLVGGREKRIWVRHRPLKRGTYRIRLTLTAPLNPGRPRTVLSPPLKLR